MDRSPSNPQELERVTEVVELPVPQGAGGSRYRMRIAAVALEDLIPSLKGILGAGEDLNETEKVGRVAGALDALDLTLNAAETLEKQARDLAKMGAFVEPGVSFDGREPGKVAWRDLHFRNRQFLVNAVARLSGQGPTEADALATFPPIERGGVEHGDRAEGAVRAAETAP